MAAQLVSRPRWVGLLVLAKVDVRARNQTNLVAVESVYLVEVIQEWRAKNPLLFVGREDSESGVVLQFDAPLVFINQDLRGRRELLQVSQRPDFVDMRVQLNLNLWHADHAALVAVCNSYKTIAGVLAPNWLWSRPRVVEGAVDIEAHHVYQLNPVRRVDQDHGRASVKQGVPNRRLEVLRVVDGDVGYWEFPVEAARDAVGGDVVQGSLVEELVLAVHEVLLVATEGHLRGVRGGSDRQDGKHSLLDLTLVVEGVDEERPRTFVLRAQPKDSSVKSSPFDARHLV